MVPLLSHRVFLSKELQWLQKLFAMLPKLRDRRKWDDEETVFI